MSSLHSNASGRGAGGGWGERLSSSIQGQYHLSGEQKQVELCNERDFHMAAAASSTRKDEHERAARRFSSGSRETVVLYYNYYFYYYCVTPPSHHPPTKSGLRPLSASAPSTVYLTPALILPPFCFSLSQNQSSFFASRGGRIDEVKKKKKRSERI